MKKIAIIGAGGFGREVACLINAINEESKDWDFIGFFDDVKDIGYENEYGRVLGRIKDLNSYPESLAVVVAIAKPSAIEVIVKSITSPNIYFPNLIAPDIIFFDKNNMSLGQGNIIGFGCSISCNIHIGNFNIFNCFISIGHDTKIGDYNAVMPSTKISGDITIGDRNFFGASSVILEKLTIGNDTTIGANSLIFRNTKDKNTYIGNPASIVKL
jgi:sugar O-acyltransferase, sialic acid O-acetyltransferase neuD family